MCHTDKVCRYPGISVFAQEGKVVTKIPSRSMGQIEINSKIDHGNVIVDQVRIHGKANGEEVALAMAGAMVENHHHLARDYYQLAREVLLGEKSGAISEDPEDPLAYDIEVAGYETFQITLIDEDQNGTVDSVKIGIDCDVYLMIADPALLGDTHRLNQFLL